MAATLWRFAQPLAGQGAVERRRCHADPVRHADPFPLPGRAEKVEIGLEPVRNTSQAHDFDPRAQGLQGLARAGQRLQRERSA